MKTTHKMAAIIAAKTEIMLKEMNMVVLDKSMMKRSFYQTNKPSPDRNGLESRAIYVTDRRKKNGYVTDAIAAKYGV